MPTYDVTLTINCGVVQTNSNTVRGYETYTETGTILLEIIPQKLVNISITHSITFTQEMYRLYTTNSILTLSQTITNQRIRSGRITQSLNLTQNVTRNNVYNLRLIQSLVFSNYRITKLNNQFLSIPTVINTIVPRKCSVRLSVPGLTIILPCPLLGDVESLSNSILIKRSMTGNTYTYIREGVGLKSLKYSFSLSRNKALELYNFIKLYNNILMFLYNWKGQLWYVYLTNNPFDFVRSGRAYNEGEDVDINLEFEGLELI